MRFLLRAAFWLSIVILLIPSGKSQDSTTPQVGASEAMSMAGAAFSDVRQFCTRQTEACAIGSQAATTFGHKAQNGAKMLYDFLSDQVGPKETGSTAPHGTTRPLHAGTPSQHTLTPVDMGPAWRGPQPKDVQPARSRSKPSRPTTSDAAS